MKKLRIGIVSPYDIFRFGGVQEHILAVRDELSKRGHKVTIVAPDIGDPEDHQKEGIITIGSATKLNTPLATTAEVSYSATPGDIKRFYMANKFDVMHFHEPWVPILSRQLLSKSSAKNIATFHAKLPDTLINKSLEKAWLPYGRSVMKYLDTLTAVSEAAVDFVSLATNKEINIVPNGIRLKEYNPEMVNKYSDFDDDVPTIFYIGRLEKRKGVDYLMKAFALLQSWHPEVRLVIGGDGPKLKTLQSYVKKNRVKNVHFLGFISTEDKLSMYKTTDVFCSPAIYGESFGIVLVEAMAMGAPIVAGNNPGYSSVMKDRGRLSLVDPKSTVGFAHRLELMLFDKEVANMMSSWGKDYVKQFDYTHVTDMYEELYRKMTV